MSEIRFTSPVATGSLPSAQLKVMSPVQTGGGMGPPLSYLLTPWVIGLNRTPTIVTSSNSVVMTGGIGTAYYWPTVSQATNTNKKISAVIHQNMYDSGIQIGFANIDGSNFVAAPYVFWNCSLTNGWVNAYYNTMITSSPTYTTDCTMSITYDGATYRFYQNDTYICEKASAVNTLRPFVYITSSGSSWTNITYSDISGSVLPLLPESYIKFK